MIHQLRQRTLIWLRRYLPAEIASLATLLCCAWAVMELSHNAALTALAATWAESLAYYGSMIIRELRSRPRLTPLTVLAVLRDIVLEFGLAELLDSMLIRPAALYLAISWLPHIGIAAIAGKLAADVIFYIPTIVSFELLRRRAQPMTKELSV
ncbi:MAG: hypothetical protein HXY39_12450 [Chloroflexi bacterium]|nr:hypothetical protein [Chloroflexota bacterium]